MQNATVKLLTKVTYLPLDPLLMTGCKTLF